MTYDELQGKLDALRTGLTRLEQIPQESYEEFAGDFRNVASAIYLLQTAIQALIDLGSFPVARLGLETPRKSQEVFERLERAGHLPAGTATRCVSIVGFRNRVVQLYDRVDDRVVYDFLTEHRPERTRLAEPI